MDQTIFLANRTRKGVRTNPTWKSWKGESTHLPQKKSIFDGRQGGNQQRTSRFKKQQTTCPPRREEPMEVFGSSKKKMKREMATHSNSWGGKESSVNGSLRGRGVRSIRATFSKEPVEGRNKRFDSFLGEVQMEGSQLSAEDGVPSQKNRTGPLRERFLNVARKKAGGMKRRQERGRGQEGKKSSNSYRGVQVCQIQARPRELINLGWDGLSSRAQRGESNLGDRSQRKRCKCEKEKEKP